MDGENQHMDGERRHMDVEQLPAPRMVELGGTEVATYRLEPETQTAGDVVLCHGTPWSSGIWAPVAHQLAQHYRVFLWDMPGYGASIDPIEERPRVDIASQSGRLAEVITSWGLDAPHVIAHDIGGAIALGAHLFNKVDFASLYLLDVVTLDPWGSEFFRLVGQHDDVFSALPMRLHAALVREYITGAAGANLDPAWIGRLAAPWCMPSGQRAFYWQIGQLRPEHTRPIVAELAQVRCPVRIGWGEDDPWIPAEQSDELASLLPGEVDVARFANTGHLVPLEAAEELSADLLTWLTSHT